MGKEVYQSGLFNVTLKNGSQWDTTKTSLIDTLSINSGSVVNVGDSTLVSDTIGLTGGAALNINEDGHVATDTLTVDNSTVTIADDVAAGWSVGDAALYANTIKVTNDGVLDVGNSADYALQTDTLNLTSTTDAGGNVHAGVFERILFSVDYPYQTLDGVKTFIDSLPVNKAEKEAIAFRNAERLLGITV